MSEKAKVVQTYGGDGSSDESESSDDESNEDDVNPLDNSIRVWTL